MTCRSSQLLHVKLFTNNENYLISRKDETFNEEELLEIVVRFEDVILVIVVVDFDQRRLQLPDLGRLLHPEGQAETLLGHAVKVEDHSPFLLLILVLLQRGLKLVLQRLQRVGL